jgi:hypothetical protein
LNMPSQNLPWYFVTSAVKSGATKEIEQLIDEMNGSRII